MIPCVKAMGLLVVSAVCRVLRKMAAHVERVFSGINRTFSGISWGAGGMS